MYGSRRTPYDPELPLEVPSELLNEQVPGANPDYFDYPDDEAWRSLPPDAQQMPLDPVDELERDLMDFDRQYLTPQMSGPVRNMSINGAGPNGPMSGNNVSGNIPGNNMPRNTLRGGPMSSASMQRSARNQSMQNSIQSPSMRNPSMQGMTDPSMGPIQGSSISPMQSHPVPMQGSMKPGSIRSNSAHGRSIANGQMSQNGQMNLIHNSLNGSMSSAMNSVNGPMNGSLNGMQSTANVMPRRPYLTRHISAPLRAHENLVPQYDPRMQSVPARSPQPQPQPPSQPQPALVVNEPPRAIQMPVNDVESISPWREELLKSRRRYKPGSSIPPDLSSINYASQCVAAAASSRLPPYSLSLGEYNHLRSKLPYIHITTYLNIRNGILRLWLANPLVAVTIVEAVGCVRDARYYLLAEFAFEWLVRNGYINYGCCTHHVKLEIASLPQLSMRRRKPRQTIVIVGAGIAGLGCARQLENLVERYSAQILTDYEDLPRVIVIEGRRRIGGRVFSPSLRTDKLNVDLGGGTVMGFGGGNPLGVLLRRQLGIPVVSVDTITSDNVLYDGKTGDPIDPQVDYNAHEIFKHLLDRMRNFEMGRGSMTQHPTSAPGIKTLIRAGQDPPIDLEAEKKTIGDQEELDPPYVADGSSDGESELEIKVEMDFLKSLGFSATQKGGGAPQEVTVHENGSLGMTMGKLFHLLSTLTDLSDKDREALNWYLAKFEYIIGDDINRASLSTWSHHRLNRFTGRHCWTRDGFSSLAHGLDSIPSKLDVRFKTVVNIIEYDEDSARITLENGEQVPADRVIVTTPLGCLKRRTVQFIPDLPQWKTDSIDRLEFGVVNKVVLLFDELFWGADVPSTIRVAAGTNEDDRGACYVFQNHSRRQSFENKALVVGLVSGKFAKSMSSMPDSEIVDPAVATLRKIFRAHPRAQTAKLVESVVTRWQLDRFARGSFSHVGIEGTTTDHDLLARPVHSSLFFAGEATSRMYPGTVHGAYISGLRAAKEVLNSFVGGIELPDNLFVEDLDGFIGVEGSERGESDYYASSSTYGSTANAAGGPSSTATVSGPQQKHVPPPSPRQDAASNYTPVSDMLDASKAPTPKRSVPSPDNVQTYEHLDIAKAESELSDLRRRRTELDAEHLKRDMLHEIGPEPIKPERQGTTNPFLLFQKDYWEICRQETETSKRNDKKSGVFHASRNEIRASLGKKWRSLPEEKRAPYIEISRQAKVENEERQEAYKRKLKWYESEAANFRQQWAQEHQSTPSLREQYLEKQLEGCRPKKKRTRLTE